MKTRIPEYLRQLREGLVQVVRQHPIESALIVAGAVASLVAYEAKSDWMMPRVMLLPVFVLLALAMRTFAGTGAWRRVYWVCWAPLIPLMLCPGIDRWLDDWQFPMTLGVLLPLLLLVCRCECRNDRFVSDAVVWLRSGVLASLFANVALGLLAAIFYSTVYIFGFEGPWVEHVMMYGVILTQMLAAPMLFLLFADRWSGAEYSGNRIVEVLLNYIVVPALLIYTVILYLYMGKIVVTWSLPRGGVAYMVFAFMLLAVAMQALQFMLQKRLYDWFFRRFALVSLPVLVLFWAGVVERVGQYGLTEARVFLLASGGLMTLFVLLFLFNRSGRYLYLCLAALVAFAALTYVPSLRPARIAARAQNCRAERIASELGLLTPEGGFELQKLGSVDSLQSGRLHKLYQSLNYLSREDTIAYARFGLRDVDQFEQALPQSMRRVVVTGRADKLEDTRYEHIRASHSRLTDGVGQYNKMYTNLSNWDSEQMPYCRFREDTLRILFGDVRPVFEISSEELLRRQLARIGMGDELRMLDTDLIQRRADEFLTYTDDSLMILFSNFQLVRRDSVWTLDEVSADVVLMR